jgi:hypothetical protein
MSNYIFPFDTCETPSNKIIAQPWSSLFNFINCIVIFYFLLQTKNNYTFLLLLAILCFEVFHLLSHMIHIKGFIQMNIVHLLTYLINIAFLYALYCHTKILPDKKFMLYLFILICLDIYAFNNLSVNYYILTQALINISILFYYYPLLSTNIQKSIKQIIPLIIICLITNEKNNCEKMLLKYSNFPFHILIEIVGIVLFYIICKNFKDL